MSIHRLTGVWLAAVLLGLAAEAYAVQARDFIVPDRKTFLMGLKLNRPELAEVKAALDRGDIEAAGKKYIAWFRRKKINIALPAAMSGKRDAKFDTSKADATLGGHLDDGYNTYEVPKSGIDWDHCRLSCLTRFPILSGLSAASHHTGKIKYVRYSIDHILEYMNAYPIETFVGKIISGGWRGGQRVARPWHWTMVCQRPQRMCETVLLAREYAEVQDEELLQILQRMHEEAAYLRREMNRYLKRRHNAGPPMIKGVAICAKVLEDFKAADEWREYAAKSFADFLGPSFYPDGVPRELGTSYSLSMIDRYLAIAALLRGNKAVEDARARLQAMITWSVAMAKPNGIYPALGDGGVPKTETRAIRYLPRLVEWLDQPWALTVLNQTDGPLPAFLNWPLKGQEQWCGYYTMRSAWKRDALYMCIDGGPWGINHQHGDKLSFVLTAFGADFIIDPTPSRYHSNEPDAFLSRQQPGFLHNTITVDGVDEFMDGNGATEVKAPLPNVWEQGKDHVLFSSSYSFDPVKPVKWERRILFAGKSYWLLQDVLSGDLKEAKIEQNFQFDKDITIEFKNGNTIATAPNGARLILIPLTGALKPVLTLGDKKVHTTYWPSGEPHTTRFIDAGKRNTHGRGWTGRWGTKLVPAPAVTYTGKVSLPAQITVAMFPLGPEQTTHPAIIVSTEGDTTIYTVPLPNRAKLTVATSVQAINVVRAGPGGRDRRQ